MTKISYSSILQYPKKEESLTHIAAVFDEKLKDS